MSEGRETRVSSGSVRLSDTYLSEREQKNGNPNNGIQGTVDIHDWFVDFIQNEQDETLNEKTRQDK